MQQNMDIGFNYLSQFCNRKMEIKFCFLLIFFTFFLSFVSADSISVDSLGNDITFTPNPYVGTGGTSPFACIPISCSSTGANCNIWSDGCGGIIDCGTCSSGYSCVSGICTAEGVVTPPSGGEEEEGGGGRRVTNITIQEITIIPREINLKMAVNTSSRQIISIMNNKNTTQTFSVSQENLANRIILGNDSITVKPGETKNLEVIFVASEETGVFTGKINLGKYSVLVNLDIKTKLLLFDSNILVLNRGYLVSQGGKLRTKVTLVPMGDKERLDVQLNYFIKDAKGEIYLTHSETVLVEDRMSLYRNFDMRNLDLGKYTIYLELVYPNGVAPSSAQFEIVKTTAESFLGFVMFTLIVAMIIVSIVIVALTIKIKIRKRTE